MLIDWFTVGAQIINFLVLVWLLKRYLYGPVLAAVDSREQARKTRYDAAVASQERADREHGEWQLLKSSMEQQRKALLDSAQASAAAERDALRLKLAAEANDLRESQLKSIHDDIEKHRGEIVDRAREEIAAIVRKVVTDLSTADLEASTVATFLGRLRAAASNVAAAAVTTPAISGGEGADLPAASGAASSDAAGEAPPRPPAARAVIRARCALALSDEQRVAVERECRTYLHCEAPLVCELAPELGLGIEVTYQHRKISWTLDDYLAAFKAQLAANAPLPANAPLASGAPP